MKKTDIQVFGSEYNKRSRESIIYMAECVEDFASVLNSALIFNKNRSDDEFSFALHLIHKLKYELLKISASVEGHIEKETVVNIVLMVRKLEIKNCFRRFCINKSVAMYTDIIRKSRFCSNLYYAYLLCIESISSCRMQSGIIADYKRIIWCDSDVLVGSLRNRQQLEIALQNGFYHVPAYMVPEDKISVSYIAIYQSKNLFSDEAGIRYFAKVLSVDKVVRRDIRLIASDSDELYYVFNVSKWQTLDRPIKAYRGGSLLNFTNLYMLLRAEIVDELYFTDEREYKLYSSIKVSLRRGYNKVATSYGNGVIAIDDGVISVYKNNTLVYSVSVSDYENNPVGRFRMILKCCK